ncbi:MAG: SCO family protein, partial [Planctomycetota bacterium]
MSASGGRLGLLAGAALVGALTVGAVGVWALSKAAAPSTGRSATPGPLDPDPGLEGLRIPDFQLVDQDGNEVDAAALLDGKVTIVDFIFTNCPFICPPMTRNMA